MKTRRRSAASLLLLAFWASSADTVVAAPATSYAQALQRLMEVDDDTAALGPPANEQGGNMRQRIGPCLLSNTMDYNPADGIRPGLQSTAAAWLRLFFHDAGSHNKLTKKYGPNGSIALQARVCTNSTQVGMWDANTGHRLNNLKPAASCNTTAFGDSCTNPETRAPFRICSAVLGVPGNPDLSSMCKGCTGGSCQFCEVEAERSENNGIFPTLNFMRTRRNLPYLQYTTNGTGSPRVKLNFSDIVVAGGIVAVEQCSSCNVKLPMYFGRADAMAVDPPGLPSPENFTADGAHRKIFQKMGLTPVDMVTLVAGSHTIGGLHADNSQQLLSKTALNATLVGSTAIIQNMTFALRPFDCTFSRDFAANSTASPFDNNIFKVACGLVDPHCSGSYNIPAVKLAHNGCPSRLSVLPNGNPLPEVRVSLTGDEYAVGALPDGSRPNFCDTIELPVGVSSDVFLCQDPPTRGLMLKYARDELHFFEKYVDAFKRLSLLSFDMQLPVLTRTTCAACSFSGDSVKVAACNAGITNRCSMTCAST